MHESSHCSTFSSAFDVVSVLDLEHSNRCVVVCHFCFNLHFPDDIWCGASFHMLICCLCIFFGEVSVKVFDPFFLIGLFSYFWVLRVFCIFWITVLYQMGLLQIFSLCGLSSHSLDIVFHRAVFHFSEIRFINYFFHGSYLCCCI